MGATRKIVQKVRVQLITVLYINQMDQEILLGLQEPQQSAKVK